MEEIKNFMKIYRDKMTGAFGDRVLFIGIQGSHARGEASEGSDLDVVLILDQMDFLDLKKYKQAVSDIPHRELLCGFVSGKEELAGWSRPELFQFYHDTVPLYGSLDEIIPDLTKKDIKQAVLDGACGIYHACSHNFIHTEDGALLAGLYKSAFFVLQAKYYCETGTYIGSRGKLCDVLTGSDREILKASLHFSKDRQPVFSSGEFGQYTELLYNWSKGLIPYSA